MMNCQCVGCWNALFCKKICVMSFNIIHELNVHKEGNGYFMQQFIMRQMYAALWAHIYSFNNAKSIDIYFIIFFFKKVVFPEISKWSLILYATSIYFRHVPKYLVARARLIKVYWNTCRSHVYQHQNTGFFNSSQLHFGFQNIYIYDFITGILM